METKKRCMSRSPGQSITARVVAGGISQCRCLKPASVIHRVPGVRRRNEVEGTIEPPTRSANTFFCAYHEGTVGAEVSMGIERSIHPVAVLDVKTRLEAMEQGVTLALASR